MAGRKPRFRVYRTKVILTRWRPLQSIHRLDTIQSTYAVRKGWFDLSRFSMKSIQNSSVSRSFAFTMVEMLIVVVVMAIVAVMAMPMLGETRTTRLAAAVELLVGGYAICSTGIDYAR